MEVIKLHLNTCCVHLQNQPYCFTKNAKKLTSFKTP